MGIPTVSQRNCCWLVAQMVMQRKHLLDLDAKFSMREIRDC